MTSSVSVAPPCPGCGSNHRCTGFCSCRSRLSLSCSFCPPGNSAWPNLDGRNSERRGTSSPTLSERPCGKGYWSWRGEIRNSVLWTRYKKKKKHTPSVLIQFVRHHSPDSGCIAEQSQLPLGLVAGEELVEISVLHVLCDHTERVAVDAHGKQANDVGVLQTWHDLYLFQEVVPAKIKRERCLTLDKKNKQDIWCRSLGLPESIPCIFIGVWTEHLHSH